MAAMAPPRQIPVKVTTAPTSVRPRVSRAVSAAASKSAVCSRMVAGIALSSSHGREERDLRGARQRGAGLDVGAVDGGADNLRIFKCKRVFFAAPGKPVHEVRHRRNAGRRLHKFLALADAFAHPGEIKKLHAHS